MSCPLCRSESVQQLFEKQGIPFGKCLSCDFVFAKPSINANLANEFGEYEPAYLRYFAESVEDERNHAALLSWVEQFCLVEGQRVLDVGCGGGKFVRFLRRNGVDASGLEPAAPLFSHFLSDDPFFVQMTLEEFSATTAAEQFSVVFAWDVIEHIERPDLLLRDAAALLQPGGTLFVSTPDVASMAARTLGRWWHFYNKYHLSYLSRKGISALAERYGLHEVGYAHLPRLRSVRYTLQYFVDFVAGGGRIHIPSGLDGFVVPLNLFDTMSLAFRKT